MSTVSSVRIYLFGNLNSEIEMLDFAFIQFTDKNISVYRCISIN